MGMMIDSRDESWVGEQTVQPIYWEERFTSSILLHFVPPTCSEPNRMAEKSNAERYNTHFSAFDLSALSGFLF
jgi:hypothetical protein